jgi:hypothetical protein
MPHALRQTRPTAPCTRAILTPEEEKVVIVHAEHAISDFDIWKGAFDRDPLRRKDSGVRRYRIARAVDDPNFLMMDFEFDDESAAQAFDARLRELWGSQTAAPALLGRPQTRLVRCVEVGEL